FVAPIELPWIGNFVRGKIPASSRERGCRWIRLISAVSATEYAETKAADSGDFALDDIKPGKYLMITIGDHGLCEVSQTTVLPKQAQDLSFDGSLRFAN